MNHSHHLDSYWLRWRQRIDRCLEDLIPTTRTSPTLLHEAMRYVGIGAGKRYRAALVYAAGDALSSREEILDRPACAVELIHAFSLVHDDLPAMDDDDLRRGKPSCHKAFDEATAILAGDALQTLAFEVLSNPAWVEQSAASRLQMVHTLADASGSLGLAGGQVLDLNLSSQDPTLQTLAAMHQRKTGALIEASVLMGGLCATDDSQILARLKNYARLLGLAFQVIDDVLDGTADTDTLGKPAGADKERGQPTFLSFLGETPARQYALDLREQAIGALDGFELDATLLIALAHFTVERSR